jgi:Scaffold protein Nfu/NifU N terminal
MDGVRADQGPARFVPCCISAWACDPTHVSGTVPTAGIEEAVPYDRAMATASPSPTPNPNAMKFTLDVSLPATMNVTSVAGASGDQFAEAVFGAGGVASLFGVNDFVTVTREPDAEWGPIVAAVQAAAEAYL